MLEQWGSGDPLAARVRLIEPSAFTKVSALGIEEKLVNVIIDFVDRPESRPPLGDGYRVEAAPDCYRGLAIFGSFAFDLCGEHGPINQIDLLIPHVVHESPANDYFADRWSRPQWLDCWPDHRISWTIGAFHPHATFRSICEQLPELADARKDGGWASDDRPEIDVYESKSGVSIFFEKASEATDDRTLSRLITGYLWGRNSHRSQ